VSEVAELLAAGDLRGAARLLEADDPQRAADLYAQLLDHRAESDARARAGDGAGALDAALRAADADRISALHARLVGGALAGVAGARGVYLRNGRADLASEVAQALGHPREAAELAEEAGLHLRAGRLWARAGALSRAAEVLEGGRGPGRAAELARVRLRQDRPAAALAARGGDLTTTLALLRLGLVEAARRIAPDLGDPVHARARLEEMLDARVASGQLGEVLIERPEPGGAGRCFEGRLEGEPVCVRVLPDGVALRHVAAAAELPGVPTVVRVDAEAHRVVTRRRGTPLPSWLAHGDAGRAARVIAASARILARAHEDGLFHGALWLDDLRILPGDLVLVDGWHRRFLVRDGATRVGDTADRLTAPEVRLGGSPTEASDAFAIGALAEAVLGVSPGPRCAKRPADRPSMRETARWIAGLDASSLALRASPQPVAEAPPGPRFAPPVGEGPTPSTDLHLDRPVRLVPLPSGVDRERLRALAAPGFQVLQSVLACPAEGPVVLEALPERAVEWSARDVAAVRADLAALGRPLGVGPAALRSRWGRLRVSIEDVLLAPGAALDAALIERLVEGAR